MDNEARKISIVVTYLPLDNDVEHITSVCLQRLEENTYYPHEIIKVNNSTFRYSHETRDTWKYDHGDNKSSVNNNLNVGNGRAWDQGVAEASNDLIILMDNDVWVEKDWDKEMIDTLSDTQIGMTFPHSIVGDELARQQAGLSVNYRGRRDGFCFAFRKSTYNLAGPFLCDQPFKLGYYEDDWFEYRVQYLLGLKLVSCPNSKVWHRGQTTTKKMWTDDVINGIEANKRWYEAKTGGKYPYLTN